MEGRFHHQFDCAATPFVRGTHRERQARQWGDALPAPVESGTAERFERGGGLSPFVRRTHRERQVRQDALLAAIAEHAQGAVARHSLKEQLQDGTKRASFKVSCGRHFCELGALVRTQSAED